VSELEKFCYWQMRVKENFDEDGNQKSWTCGTHLHESRANDCPYNSLKEASGKYHHPCVDAKPPEVKAVSLEELFKQIENLCQVEMDLAQQNKEFAIYQSADYLKREIPKLVESFVAGLRDLRNDFPNPELVYNKRYQTEVIKNPQVFASLCWKWLKRFDVALEGGGGEQDTETFK